MIKETRTLIRPSTAVEFPNSLDADAMNHFRNVYTGGATPLILEKGAQISEDLLVVKLTKTFVSQAAYDQFLADTVMSEFTASVEAACQAAGIQFDITTETV